MLKRPSLTPKCLAHDTARCHHRRTQCLGQLRAEDRIHPPGQPMDLAAEEPPHPVRARVANACDACKARKVKCDGKSPCSFCVRRQRGHACHYSPPVQRRRRRPRIGHSAGASPFYPHPERINSHSSSSLRSHPPSSSGANSAFGSPRLRGPPTNPAARHHADSGSPGPGQDDDVDDDGSTVAAQPEEHDEAEVPREARLVCDAQGKLIFIGDCAPLSFFQTVRQLVTSRVDPAAFAPQTSRFSILENAQPRHATPSSHSKFGPPAVDPSHVRPAVLAYLTATTGLVDLFVDNVHLAGDISVWIGPQSHRHDEVTTAIGYLVLAIGCQKTNEDAAQVYFEYARDRALVSLGGNLSVGTVQAFVLITLYMLTTSQINGAFLFFGIAVRAAYSIGVHRTEVNSRFGADIHRQRDRLWKSLRIVDLFLSTSMGRPPNTSDVDCTVPYRTLDGQGHEVYDVLNASVQIFLIIECVVLEVYSRRKISLQLTEGISRQLREWSARWLQQLKQAMALPPREENVAQINGACQTLASYYYGVMLVSRPFLMYELRQRLSEEEPATTPLGRAILVSGKLRLADACIDAASLMVDPVLNLIEQGIVTGHMPVLVSWLFACSLVLGVGLLGGFGRVLEKYARMTITALEHFAKSDTHAGQYALIGRSLLTTALQHLEKAELRERSRRTESSSQLFGLVPLEPEARDQGQAAASRRGVGAADGPSLGQGGMMENSGTGPKVGSVAGTPAPAHDPASAVAASPFADFSSALFSMSDSPFPRTPDLSFLSGTFEADGADQATMGALNLFPLLDGEGHIDLAHYL
ncbi:uncharacterized protein E0L32_011032 [Thyridium curvatum]|uniref:Zn(2)-C6 fungal-type domain-containing protein n=1 Tax=Thyridium curvatum TaxID=1093900 RepID=A0A507ALM4_9PEZI|nr:uncharacterized protein E0L32_011032 [Thyridium curvatum]TPX07044.1 hypothetical protein E0L32_011032 [Thyridium curvatum]